MAAGLVAEVQTIIVYRPHQDEIRGISKQLVRRYKPPTRNITKEQFLALNQLRNNSNLTITSADKGDKTVLLDTATYEEKIVEQLNNTDVYQELPSDPTIEFEVKIKKHVASLLKYKRISPQEAKKLKPTESEPPHVFALVKLHKPNNPLRLITVAKKSPNTELQKFIAPTIKKLATSDTQIKNSKVLISKLQDYIFPTTYQHRTRDVINLFTNICQLLISDHVNNELESSDINITVANLTNLDTLTTVHLIFETTYVSFKNKFYLKMSGVPMGGYTSKELCDVVLNTFDN